MGIDFKSVEVALNGQMDNHTVNATEWMQGAATARYSVDEERQILTLQDFGGDGIQVTVEINGYTLVDGNFPAWRAFSGLLIPRPVPRGNPRL
jgi:hypothetical protein